MKSCDDGPGPGQKFDRVWLVGWAEAHKGQSPLARCVLDLVAENERLRAAQDCSTESGRALTPEEITEMVNGGLREHARMVFTEIARSLQREPISEGPELLRLADDGCPNAEVV